MLEYEKEYICTKCRSIFTVQVIIEGIYLFYMICRLPKRQYYSVLKSILLSQGQSIYHDNALYISNYYFYFIEGNKTF
jgi:hypothetical protein